MDSELLYSLFFPDIFQGHADGPQETDFPQQRYLQSTVITISVLLINDLRLEQIDLVVIDQSLTTDIVDLGHF